MNVAVLAPSHVPFVWGGLERLAFDLATHLNAGTSHRADLLRLPTREGSLLEVVQSYRMWAALEVDSFDAVVSLKYPTWMAAHPCHVVWMAHRLRGLYDTYPAAWPEVAESLSFEASAARVRLLEAVRLGAPNLEAAGYAVELVEAVVRYEPALAAYPGPLAREVVHALDDLALQPGRIRRHAAISGVVAARRGYFPPDVRVTVVHPPVTSGPIADAGPPGESFFTASRLDRPKRLDLVVRAFRRARTPLPLLIAGSGPEEATLRELAAGDPRIHLLGFVSEDELRRRYAGARAVVFVPADEDYGYVTLEAFRAGRAVITCSDSGAPADLVRASGAGVVVAAEETALAAAFDRFGGAEREEAARMGEAGRRAVAAIRWEAVVPALLGDEAEAAGEAGAASPHPAPPLARAFRRPRRHITAVLPFPVTPAFGGGRVRVLELFRRFAAHADVDLVCLNGLGTSWLRELAPGLREIVIGSSPAHRMREAILAEELGGLPVADVAMPALLPHTPLFETALALAAARSDVLVASHPYAAPALFGREGPIPIVYEAQDVEIDLKRRVFAGHDAARPLLDLTQACERWCLENAVVTLVCSREDEALLGACYPGAASRFALVPNGVDDEATPFLGPDERARGRAAGARRLCVFVGSWHPPNIDAVETLAAVAPALPDVDFVVVGNVVGALAGREFPPNLRLAGFVSAAEKTALLHAADLAVNPMRYGSGTNLKLLDYFAAGTPVLTTPTGLRGLGEFRDAVAVAAIEDLPGALRRLLAGAGAGTEAGTLDTRAARRLVEERYSWRAIAEKAFAELRPWLG